MAVSIGGDEDDDRDLAGSQDGSSDEEMDDVTREAEDVDGDNEPEQDIDSPSNFSQVSGGGGETSHQNADGTMRDAGASNPHPNLHPDFHPRVRPECLTATTYDIVPTTAAPHSTSINAVTATADMRWVFSAGTDGYIRKFNWPDTVNSKLMLTVAQRHPFVDSVVKAGVLMTYWDNKEDEFLHPIYSLACQSQGLWLLSGLSSGSIRLQSTRHEEGKVIARLDKHTSAVSALALTFDEKSLLSGSWDKRVYDWDLNTGQIRRLFGASAGQIAVVEIRPESSVPIPQDTVAFQSTSESFTSNNQAPTTNGFDFTTINDERDDSGAVAIAPAASPADSLFGGADSLFGDADGGAADGGDPSDPPFGADEEHVFGRALANDILGHADTQSEMRSANELNGVADLNETPVIDDAERSKTARNFLSDEDSFANGLPEPAVNGLPHAEEIDGFSQNHDFSQQTQVESNLVSDTTFLAASIDGTIRVWDRRQRNPVARVTPRNVPPWCMSACWSPDGNYIYAGRRNGTVEEFSLHKGLKSVERVFKFPQGSGPVTALKAMPNGRHIVCASYDILRLYDLKHEPVSRHTTVPFLIVPGHRTGTISQLYIDNACRFMISTSGNRGWEGNTNEVLLGYEIGVPR